MDEKKVILEGKGISKYFHSPKTVQVIKELDISIEKNEFVSIVGKSGCGKSTLLYILSTMDTDFEGELKIDGVSMLGKLEAELAQVRNEKIGFIFQFHYLLNEFSVLKNIMLPGLKLRKYSSEEVEHNAYEKLKILGIEDQALKMPNQLSGGQKQRVAIARSLINDPVIIMADEPTGNLDHKNTEIVFNTFNDLSESFGLSLLVVTHDQDFAARTHRIVEMSDGRVLSHDANQ